MPVKTRKTEKADPPPDDDPWVELRSGYVRDQILPITGQIAEVVVHTPGTRMRRSQAIALGIDDAVEVDGPDVAQAGYQIVLTPAAPQPGFGTVETSGQW